METEYEVDIDLEELERTSGGVIPSHSHLMGAWVSAGILGALFWGYIVWISSKAVVRVATLLPALAPLYAVVVPGLIWMVMFWLPVARDTSVAIQPKRWLFAGSFQLHMTI